MLRSAAPHAQGRDYLSKGVCEMSADQKAAAKGAGEALTPAMQRKVEAVGTLRYATNRYLDYVRSDERMLERVREIFGSKGDATNLEAARNATRLTTKTLTAMAEEIERNALEHGFAAEENGTVVPVKRQAAQAKLPEAKQPEAKAAKAKKQPAKQAAQTKPPAPPAQAVRLPDEIAVPFPEGEERTLVVRREPEVNTLADLESLLARHAGSESAAVMLGVRWTEQQIKSHYMRINRQPPPEAFHEGIDLMEVMYVQRPCEVGGRAEHKYRNIILRSIYTDGVSHLSVEKFARDEKLPHFAIDHEGKTVFHADVYAGEYGTEEKPASEKPKKPVPKKGK